MMHGTLALVEMTENLTRGCFLPVMIPYDDEHRMCQIGIDAKKELSVSSKDVEMGDDVNWEMGMAGDLSVKTVVYKYYYYY